MGKVSINDCDAGAFRSKDYGGVEYMWLPAWYAAPGGWFKVTPNGYDPASRQNFDAINPTTIYGVPGTGYAGLTVGADGYVSFNDQAVEVFTTSNGHVGFRPRAVVASSVVPTGASTPMPMPAAPLGTGAGLGSGPASSPILVLMLQQQRMAPFQQMLDDGKDDVNGATDEVTSGAALLEYQQAVMQLIAPPPAEGTQAALFAALLGQSTVAALVQAQREFNEVAQAPASQAALNTAWNDWKDAFAAALAAQSQQELMLKLAGGGAVGTGAVLAVMFVQQAITTFTSATNATAGATLGNLQEDFGDWDDAFRTLITSTNTNKLLLAAMGA